MQITKIFSHKGGKIIQEKFSHEWQDVVDAVEQCSAVACLSKMSDEKTKPPLLFSPVAMNLSIKKFLCPRGWTIPNPNSKKGFKEHRVKLGNREFREMDGIKNKIGLEIQFGKYAFMGYDLFSKMPIFSKRGLINYGVELVAAASMLRDMSTGVSSYEQIVLDIQNRGEADLDIPSLVVGISPTVDEWEQCRLKRDRFSKDKSGLLATGEVSEGFNGAKPGPKGANFDWQEVKEEAEDEGEAETGETSE